jgi:MSHA biogenesis protein MshI
MRWRLREAIDFPVEDAVIDVFDVPTGGRTQGRMLNAVAARRSVVDQHAAGLAWSSRFDVIDVPEMVLRNLAARIPASANGIAFLHLGESMATIVLVRGSTFYFSRQMVLQTGPQPLDAAPGETILDATSVALELQRSLDYYERHFDQPPITQVCIAPAGPRARALMDALSAETGLSVSEFDLNAQLQCAAPVDPRTQQSCLLAVGAALRVERRTL